MATDGLVEGKLVHIHTDQSTDKQCPHRPTTQTVFLGDAGIAHGSRHLEHWFTSRESCRVDLIAPAHSHQRGAIAVRVPRLRFHHDFSLAHSRWVGDGICSLFSRKERRDLGMRGKPMSVNQFSSFCIRLVLLKSTPKSTNFSTKLRLFSTGCDQFSTAFLQG